MKKPPVIPLFIIGIVFFVVGYWMKAHSTKVSIDIGDVTLATGALLLVLAARIWLRRK